MLTAMATPFDEDGAVDDGAARSLAVHLLEHGSHGLVVAGSTGECPTLTDEETIELLRRGARRGRRRGAADLRHRHQRHPPLDAS